MPATQMANLQTIVVNSIAGHALRMPYEWRISLVGKQLETSNPMRVNEVRRSA